MYTYFIFEEVRVVQLAYGFGTEVLNLEKSRNLSQICLSPSLNLCLLPYPVLQFSKQIVGHGEGLPSLSKAFVCFL